MLNLKLIVNLILVVVSFSNVSAALRYSSDELFVRVVNPTWSSASGEEFFVHKNSSPEGTCVSLGHEGWSGIPVSTKSLAFVESVVVGSHGEMVNYHSGNGGGTEVVSKITCLKKNFELPQELGVQNFEKTITDPVQNHVIIVRPYLTKLGTQYVGFTSQSKVSALCTLFGYKKTVIDVQYVVPDSSLFQSDIGFKINQYGIERTPVLLKKAVTKCVKTSPVGCGKSPQPLEETSCETSNTIVANLIESITCLR